MCMYLVYAEKEQVKPILVLLVQHCEDVGEHCAVLAACAVDER